MHEIMQFQTSISTAENVPDSLAIDLPVSPPQPFVGPQAAADPNEIVQGTRLLQQIALMPEADVAAFVSANPEAISGLIAHPPAPQDVSLWWNSMQLDSRNALRAASPQLVGNIDGIPFAVRDIANRTLLDSTMASLQSTINGEVGRTVVENAKYQLAMLTSIADALSEKSLGATRTLMTLDVTGQGRAAIIIGDLRNADYVTYMVPGMFFTIEGQMVYWTDAASRMRDEQIAWLTRFGDADSTVAAVAWIGYHTPNLTNIGSMDNAYEAEDSLASTIKGLQTLRATDAPYICVVAHSYGSTAALMALTDYDFEVDSLVVVGSPGSPAQAASDLHVRAGQVYVGEADFDLVTNSAFFGSDPGAPSYGATPFGTNGGTDAITGDSLIRSFGHIEYFSPGTESLRNIALIGIGKGAYVSHE